MSTFIEIIKDHLQYRHQIFKLAIADLKKTYRGAALGWMWAIIKPAVTIFVYWFTFEIGLRAGKAVNGFPFFLWLLAGVIPWFYMSSMITSGTDSIRRYSYLVTKMKFPISTIPTFVSISKFIVHIFLIIITIIIFALMGRTPTIYMLQLPFYMLLNLLFFTVFSLFSGLLASMSKDYANLVKSFVTAVFWLSGIIFNINTVSEPWLKSLLMLNPVAFLVEGYRNCFINHIWFWEQPKRLMYFGIITLILLILGLFNSVNILLANKELAFISFTNLPNPYKLLIF